MLWEPHFVFTADHPLRNIREDLFLLLFFDLFPINWKLCHAHTTLMYSYLNLTFIEENF